MKELFFTAAMGLAVTGFSGDGVEYIAHQGEEALAPSHSRAAYRLAAGHGLDWLKLDVRETKDGHVVLQHDATLKATMKWDEKISDLTLAEIVAKGRCRTRTIYTNETITTLTDALDIAKGMRKGLWIDFKHFSPTFAEKVLGRVYAAGYGNERLMVATWNRKALRWLMENHPGVRRVAHTYIHRDEGGFRVNALASGENGERACATEAELADALDALGKALGLHGFNLPAPSFTGRRGGYDTTPELIAELHRRGYWVSIWFVYNAAAGEFYRKAGADAFVTNCKANTFPPKSDGEVVVSRDFGFDPNDSTRFLQAALASGAAKIVVDRQTSDWVALPLKGGSNQTVVFEKGVVLRAKPGAYHGRADCLLSYIGCTNVTLSGYGAALRMERAAYGRPPYKKSEHRHTLSIRGGRDIRVEGLTLEESGGDGVYLVTLRRGDGTVQPPENITLRDVKCVRNYRQGLSVIAVKGLVCENCDFSETAGTPPESGVDFEPNWPDEVLQDIVFRRCRFENNKGRGFEFYLGNLNAQSAPVTARFENCVTRGNVNGFEYQQRRKTFNDLPVGGKVELENCVFENSTSAGVLIIDKPETSASISFRGCRMVDCCTVGTNGPDVRLQTRLWDTPPVKGVDFSGLEIRQPFARPKFSAAETDWAASGVTVPRFGPFDFTRASVADAAPGIARPLGDAACPAGSFALVVYADRSRTVTLKARMVALSRQPVVPATVKVERGGRPLRKVRLPAIMPEPTELSFKAQAGFTTLKINAGRHAVRFLEANVPLAVAVTRAEEFSAEPGKAWFWTDARRPFALFAGANSYEKGAVSLSDPSGRVVWSRNPITGWERFQPAASDVAEGLWQIETKRPRGIRRTVHLDLVGTAGFVFLSPERYWK